MQTGGMCVVRHAHQNPVLKATTLKHGQPLLKPAAVPHLAAAAARHSEAAIT
jgi:hypothetical protein